MERVALLIAVLVFYCRTTLAASDPCQNIQCGDNRECYLGKCFNTFSSADCRDSCLQNQICTFGECTSLFANDTATCNSICRESEECRFGQCYTTLTAPCASCPSSSQCLLGSCVQSANLCSQCTQGQWCGTGGTCVNFASNASCAQSCRQDEICTYGACVPLSSTLSFTSPCRDTCLRNQKCANIAIDEETSNWACVYANAGCANGCPYGENETAPVCSYGACHECDFCANINDMFVQNLMHLNLLQNLTVQSIEINSTNVPIVFEDGTLAVTQGLRTPNGFATRWQSLVFGTEGANGTAIFGISPGATIEVQNQTHFLSTNAIIISKSSVLQNTMWKISENADVMIAFDSASIDLEMSRLVTFELQLNGRLVVAGEGSLTLPQDVAKFRASPLGSFLVSGSAAVSGDLSAIPLVVSPFGPYPAEMRVSSNTVLRSSNNILGQKGRMLVLGTVVTSGLIVQPTIQIGNGGLLSVQGPALKAGNLLLASGGQLEINSLGSSVYFSEIQTCAEGASISYKLNDTLEGLFQHCNDVEICSGVIMRYASATFRNAGKFACTIKLQDRVGARMTLTLHNSTKPIMHGLGAISNYAVFDTNSLAFYVQNAEADVAPPSGGLSAFSKSMLGFGIMGAFFISCVAATVCYRRKKKKREEKYLLESDDEPLPRAALNYDNYSSMASSSHSES